MYAATTSLSKGDKKDAAVHIWDLESGCIVRAFRGGICSPRSLHMSKSLILAGQVGRPAVNSWIPNLEKLHLKIPLSDKMTCLTATNDNYICATGNSSGGITVWEIATGNMLCVLPAAHYRRVSAIKFTADGSHLISGSDDATVRVWKTHSLVGGGKTAVGAPIAPVHTWSDHTLPVTDVHCGFGGLSARVVTASKDSSCKLYDLASGELVQSFAFETDVQSVTMDSTEQMLFAGGGNGVVYTCDVAIDDVGATDVAAPLRSTRRPFMGHKAVVGCLAVSFDASTLISGSEDGTVRVWDIESRQCTKVYTHKDAVTNVAMVPQSWITMDRAQSHTSAVNVALTPFSRRPFTLDASAMAKTEGVTMVLNHGAEYNPVSKALVPDSSDLRVASVMSLTTTTTTTTTTAAAAASTARTNTSDSVDNEEHRVNSAEVEQWQLASENLYQSAVNLLLTASTTSAPSS